MTPSPHPDKRTKGGASGSAVTTEPFEHLIQHIKQSDPMLYEALKRQSKYFTIIQNAIEHPEALQSKFDKATFGIQKPIVIGPALTLYYVCRKGGDFIDTVAKIRGDAPDKSGNNIDTVFDILRSTDDGATFISLYNSSAKITFPTGSTNLVIVPKAKFAQPSIKEGDLLRIDCVSAASPNPGSNIEFVTRWE